jgi:tRNA (guanine-N7-)-methyltransferase
MPKAGFPGRKPISRTSSDARSELPHRRKLYGRRKGPSLSAHQTGLLETLLPRLLLSPRPGLDPREYFATSSTLAPTLTDVWLEIGFGAGEHLFWQAQNHPDTGIIGVEPYVAGVAKLLSKLGPLSPLGGEGQGEGARHRWRGTNIRLYTEDARDIVAALPEASLGRVFILFPDPWPKTRHHKRRFIQMEMLDQLARVMGKGAELRFATDDSGYLVWALERFVAHPQFRWMANCAGDWRTRPPDWPETRYEAKALKSGRPCAYLRFSRV